MNWWVKIANKRWPDQLRKIVLDEQNKPMRLSQLEYAFIDSEGKKYYVFPDNTAMPMSRFQKLSGFYTLLANGVSKSWMDEWLEEMDKLLTEGLTQGKNAAQLGAMIAEMKQRMEMVLSYDLIMEILAVQFIREDEDPEAFSEAIHREKTNTFLSEEGLPSFFLQRKELIELERLLGIHGVDWNRLQVVWKKTEEVRKQMLKTIRSAPTTSDKTSQPAK